MNDSESLKPGIRGSEKLRHTVTAFKFAARLQISAVLRNKVGRDGQRILSSPEKIAGDRGFDSFREPTKLRGRRKPPIFGALFICLNVLPGCRAFVQLLPRRPLLNAVTHEILMKMLLHFCGKCISPWCTIELYDMKELLRALSPEDADWRIANQLDPLRLPAHVAIIMDGNGRWAKQRNYPRIMGHRAGVNAVRTAVETCAQLGLEALTLYAFSVENWKRPRNEVEGLWRLLRFYLRKELASLMKNDIQLEAIGRIESLPAVVQAELHSVIDQTSSNRGMRLNLAINYGGRTELVDAVNAMLENARHEGNLEALEITEEAIAEHLYTAGQKDPDLLIRTSGEMRVSNFLLWQIAYAELYVTETLWPDFARRDLLEAIGEFQSRERRFGGLARSAAPAIEPSELLLDDEALELPLAHLG
jgi:undecaprenyl diphosphate synthase